MERVTKKDVAAQIVAIAGGDYKGARALSRIVITAIMKGMDTNHAWWTDPADTETRLARLGLVISIPKEATQIGLSRNTQVIATSAKVESGNVVVDVEFECHISTVKTEPKMKWVDIDADTRKRVPVLDENRQPVMKTHPPEFSRENVIGKMTFPISVLSDLLNEIERPTLLEDAPSTYVPPRLGEALASLLPGASLAHILPPMMPMRMRGGDYWGPDYGQMAMMMHHSQSHAIPCRLFLAPADEAGRVEIIAEPYSDEELSANRTLRKQRESWAKWNHLFDTEAMKVFELPPEPEKLT